MADGDGGLREFLRSVARIAFTIAAGYALFWLAAYAWFVRGWTMLPEYVVWSWTGGGPIVTLVHFAGLFGALSGGVVALLVRLR